jgi:hypothetical protein
MQCFSHRTYRLLYIILVDCSDILDFSELFLCLNFDLALVLAGRNASSNIEAGPRLDPFSSSSYRLVQLNSGNAHKTFEASIFDSQNRSNRDGTRNEKYAPSASTINFHSPGRKTRHFHAVTDYMGVCRPYGTAIPWRFILCIQFGGKQASEMEAKTKARKSRRNVPERA